MTVLSAIPGQRFMDLPFSFADKAVHVALFLSGAVFLTAAVRATFAWDSWRVIGVAVIAMALLGVADEVHQLWTPGRSGGDVGDMIADALGGLFGVVFVILIHGLRRKRKEADPGTSGADRPA